MPYIRPNRKFNIKTIKMSLHFNCFNINMLYSLTIAEKEYLDSQKRLAKSKKNLDLKGQEIDEILGD
jgi:hypothetical protein